VKVNIGGNVISDCEAALVVNGIEVFRFHRRHHDGRLVSDFEVRREDGELIAKIANDRVVHVAEGYRRHDLPRECYIESPQGAVVARVREEAEDELTIWGEFWVDGHRVLIGDRAIESGGISISGQVIAGCGKAIALGPHSAAIGAA
jgi:hypothetical protein